MVQVIITLRDVSFGKKSITLIQRFHVKKNRSIYPFFPQGLVNPRAFLFVLILVFIQKNISWLSFQTLHLLKDLSAKLKISMIIPFIYVIPGKLVFPWFIDGLKKLSFSSLFCKSVSRSQSNYTVLLTQFLSIRARFTVLPTKSLQCSPHLFTRMAFLCVSYCISVALLSMMHPSLR